MQIAGAGRPEGDQSAGARHGRLSEPGSEALGEGSELVESDNSELLTVAPVGGCCLCSAISAWDG